jgi:hypothetical protein
MRVARIAGIAMLTAACMTGRRPGGSPGGPAPLATSAKATETEGVVRAQVEAYNRRDLGAFLATFAQDARLYAFPDSLLYAGRDALRPVYARLFEQAPGLRADVTHRIVQGAFVIDREVTTGMPGRAPLTGVAIYEVRGGLVTRVWFVD